MRNHENHEPMLRVNKKTLCPVCGKVPQRHVSKTCKSAPLLQVWNKAICEWFTIFSLWGIYHG